MYIGSSAFQAANAKSAQKHRVRGFIDDIPFSSRNVLAGSMNITNQCSEESDYKIGAVFVGQLTVTFLRNLSVIPTSWKNRKISVIFGLCIDEVEDIYEEFPLGEFYVSEAEITADGVSVTAYDAMSRFDEKLPSDFLASGTLFDITAAICQTCGVTFGMTQQQVAALPNGSQPLGLYTPNECKTYRDIIFWLSNAVAGFATINTEGKLVYRSYSGRSASQLNVGPSKRVQGAGFSDFSVEFQAVLFENADGTIQRTGNQASGPVYYNGFNPLLEFGTAEARAILRNNVSDAIRAIDFVPFTVDIMSAPIFELGDILEFTGGIIEGTDKIGIVQGVEWNLNRSLVIRGFGADPALQDVMSAEEQADAATRRSDQNSEVIYRDFTNLVPISVTSEPVKVVDIFFTNNKSTDVEMWHEIQLRTLRTAGNSDMTVQAVYYMDSVEMARKPIETYDDDAFHILDLHYFKNIEEIGSHRWEVFLVASGGTAQIGSNDSLAVLKGQGLTKADGWTGVIILEDEITEPFMNMIVPQMTESVTLSMIDRSDSDHFAEIDIQDVLTPPFMAMAVDEYVEDINITLYTPKKTIVTENKEYNITDESGDYNITTE